MLKISLYVIFMPLIIWCLDGVNLSVIFKKNRVVQARLIYLFSSISLTYLVVNFLYDFLTIYQNI